MTGRVNLERVPRKHSILDTYGKSLRLISATVCPLCSHETSLLTEEDLTGATVKVMALMVSLFTEGASRAVLVNRTADKMNY